jgi:hypothetical protein
MQQQNRMQRVATVVAMLLGIWGAGLSTYQQLRLNQKEKPTIYTQLTVSREPYLENAKSRPATFAVKVHNSGEASITLRSMVSFVVYNPASGLSSMFRGHFDSEDRYPLPRTLKPGDQVSATAIADESESLFGPDVQYLVVVQGIDNQFYVAENTEGPIRDATAAATLRQHAKYQSMIDFESRAAVAVSQ